ncbi:MAG: hypothetical protein QNJ67_17875 [Kiloniellales bacterium]|nr:hypothetical protein [Kiloniellales bacterium]
MSFRSRSEAAAKAVFESLGTTPDEQHQKKVVAAIERAIVDAVAEANQHCTQVAIRCCSADKDMAHKIAAEIKRDHQALVANLSSLR